MSEDTFPARIHILVAQESPFGVVIRRGPSKQTCVLSWNRKTNEFRVSQWLQGRMYERRSDLSPDGKHMIYFAMNGKWDSEAKGAWTAISRAPWLKAVTLYAKGDCWFGGGLFLSNIEYWLNDGDGHTLVSDTKELQRRMTCPSIRNYGGECLTIYYNRLQRDGWKLTERQSLGKHSEAAIFEKKIAKGWILRKTAHEQIGAPEGKGCYWDEHALIPVQGESLAHPDWEWADWVDGKLAWVSGGCLYQSGIKSGTQVGLPALLHDFNHYTYERHQAPY